ncbi:MAG: nucleoside phosphorylase [Thermodesulfobacteriota bacterium]
MGRPKSPDPHAPLVRPVTGKGGPFLRGPAVMVSSGPDLKPMAKALGIPPESSRPFFIGRFYQDPAVPAVVCGPVMGAPYAVFALEYLMAWGARPLFYLGWCGTLREEIEAGAVIVPPSAYVEEGTSGLYHQEMCTGMDPAPSSAADPALSGHLFQVLSGLGANVVSGPVWTTDAIFRETRAKVSAFAGLGAVAVDMETSALFTVARMAGVPLAAALVVSDSVHGGKWTPGFNRKEFLAGRKFAVEALCRIVSELTRKP